MYNENVMKYTGGTLPEVYDEEDVVVYDDSSEWYNNIDASEADD